MSAIKYNDISVVVQGAVHDKDSTKKCLNSVRKYLPDAEIILSTWEGSDVSDLEYDKVVYSKDPGCYFCDDLLNVPLNLNRQIVSTQNGLKEASRKYVLKLRTDFYLLNDNFLKYWDKFSLQNDEYRLFSHRLIVSSIYSREYSYTTKRPILFHPSDFFIFGLNEDMKKYLGETRLATDEELGGWRFKYPNRLPYYQSTHRYTAEQYICFSCVKKYFPEILYEDWTDYNSTNLAQSQKFMANNFIFLDVEQSGITSEKHTRTLKETDFYGIIDYKTFYARYASIFEKDETKKQLIEKYYKNDEKLQKHIRRFKEPFIYLKKLFIETFFEIISISRYYISSRMILNKLKKYEKGV